MPECLSEELQPPPRTVCQSRALDWGDVARHRGGSGPPHIHIYGLMEQRTKNKPASLVLLSYFLPPPFHGHDFSPSSPKAQRLCFRCTCMHVGSNVCVCVCACCQRTQHLQDGCPTSSPSAVLYLKKKNKKKPVEIRSVVSCTLRSSK